MSGETPSGGSRDDKPARLPLRFLVGVKERAAIPALVAHVGTVGANGRAIARVVDVVELAGRPGGLTLESVEEASDVVDEASFLVRMSGVGADGMVRQGHVNRVGPVLLEEASNWHADAVVLLSRRGGSWRRLFASGVREQLLHESRISTVLVSRQTYATRQWGRSAKAVRGR